MLKATARAFAALVLGAAFALTAAAQDKKGEILGQLFDLNNNVKSGDTVVIMFAGHGLMIPDQGFYLLLNPLAPGTHTLTFGGAGKFAGSKVSQNITYVLTIK